MGRAEDIQAMYRAKAEAEARAKPSRYPGGHTSWVAWIKAEKAAEDAAAKAAANGEAQAPTSPQSGEPPAGHEGAVATGSTQSDAARTMARTHDELKAWAQVGIDDELDEVETDPPGTRNDRLKDHASRCFRLALRAGFDLDDVYDALFDAARVAGAVDPPHTDTEIRTTLRKSRAYAIAQGPAPMPRDLIDIVEVDEL